MEDPKNANIDVGTKSTYPMIMNLISDLNFTYITNKNSIKKEKLRNIFFFIQILVVMFIKLIALGGW